MLGQSEIQDLPSLFVRSILGSHRPANTPAEQSPTTFASGIRYASILMSSFHTMCYLGMQTFSNQQVGGRELLLFQASCYRVSVLVSDYVSAHIPARDCDRGCTTSKLEDDLRIVITACLCDCAISPFICRMESEVRLQYYCHYRVNDTTRPSHTTHKTRGIENWSQPIVKSREIGLSCDLAQYSQYARGV